MAQKIGRRGVLATIVWLFSGAFPKARGQPLVISSKKGLPSVMDATHSHCGCYWPQFRQFSERELREDIDRVLAKDAVVPYEGNYTHIDQYFKHAYKNWEILVEQYRIIRGMPFLEACDCLSRLENSYIRYDLYAGLHPGEVYRLIPCCR